MFERQVARQYPINEFNKLLAQVDSLSKLGVETPLELTQSGAGVKLRFVEKGFNARIDDCALHVETASSASSSEASSSSSSSSSSSCSLNLEPCVAYTGYAHCWHEVVPDGSGGWYDLPGGRRGTNCNNPAYERNGVCACIGEVVWLDPGVNGEYIFTKGCPCDCESFPSSDLPSCLPNCTGCCYIPDSWTLSVCGVTNGSELHCHNYNGTFVLTPINPGAGFGSGGCMDFVDSDSGEIIPVYGHDIDAPDAFPGETFGWVLSYTGERWSLLAIYSGNIIANYLSEPGWDCTSCFDLTLSSVPRSVCQWPETVTTCEAAPCPSSSSASSDSSGSSGSSGSSMGCCNSNEFSYYWCGNGGTGCPDGPPDCYTLTETSPCVWTGTHGAFSVSLAYDNINTEWQLTLDNGEPIIYTALDLDCVDPTIFSLAFAETCAGEAPATVTLFPGASCLSSDCGGSSSSSGSGQPSVTCCENTLPSILTASYFDTINCACVTGAEVTLTWNGTVWTGSAEICGIPTTLTLTCNVNDWDLQVSSGCVNTNMTATSANCDPVSLTFNFIGGEFDTCCASTGTSVEITITE